MNKNEKEANWNLLESASMSRRPVPYSPAVRTSNLLRAAFLWLTALSAPAPLPGDVTTSLPAYGPTSRIIALIASRTFRHLHFYLTHFLPFDFEIELGVSSRPGSSVEAIGVSSRVQHGVNFKFNSRSHSMASAPSCQDSHIPKVRLGEGGPTVRG